MLNFLAVLFKTVAWPSCHRPQQGSAIAISICNSFAASVASCKLAYRARNLANRGHRLRLLFYLHIPYPYPISKHHIPYPCPAVAFALLFFVFRHAKASSRNVRVLFLTTVWAAAPPSNFLTPSCPLLHFSLMTFYLVLRRLPKNKK